MRRVESLRPSLRELYASTPADVNDARGNVRVTLGGPPERLPATRRLLTVIDV
jgi:hypothetical protein